MHSIAKKTLNKIIENGNHYCVQLKGNQKNLLKDVMATIETSSVKDINTVREKKNGVTTCWQATTFEYENQLVEWKSIKVIVVISKTIYKKDQQER